MSAPPPLVVALNALINPANAGGSESIVETSSGASFAASPTSSEMAALPGLSVPPCSTNSGLSRTSRTSSEPMRPETPVMTVRIGVT